MANEPALGSPPERSTHSPRRLEARTEELARALHELRTTQAQVVESEKQAVLGRLVAGIVHELNSPLGALRSSADTIARSLEQCSQMSVEPSLDERKRLHRMLESSSDLARLQQTGVSRISAMVDGLKGFVGLDQAEIKPFDVREGLESALTLLKPAFGERVRVVRAYPGEPAQVLCYPSKICQAFLHVLQNATQAIEGEGEIRVEVANRDREVSVLVRDDGRGIPEEKLAGLFELGLAEKGGRVGMRLGLPMTKRHLEEIGGRLRVESREGEGTSVLLSLPRAGP
jgi:signal transduction histidine kinase